MKKLLPILIAFMFTLSSAQAIEEVSNPIEEVVLEVPSEVEEVNNPSDDVEHEKTLREKLSDVYHLEVERIDKPTYLFEDILTKRYSDDSIMDKTQLWVGYNGDIGMYFNDDTITN